MTHQTLVQLMESNGRLCSLLILALPEFFLAGDTFNLLLCLVKDLLSARLQFVIEATLGFFARLLHLIDLSIEEFNLLGQKGLLTT